MSKKMYAVQLEFPFWPGTKTRSRQTEQFLLNRLNIKKNEKFNNDTNEKGKGTISINKKK